MIAQMADPNRQPYPPPQEYSGYAQHSPPPPRHDAPRDDGRSSYPPPPDPNRQGQYPPAPQPYPPPQQWAGQPQGQPAYHQPPPNHSHYPPPQYHYQHAPQPNQGPVQHDHYRLPPPMPYGYYPTPYPAPPAPAPRQRTAIACKYCRKRKIRCSGYDSSPDGRCQNCVRFNQTCLFHPVSSQAAFVPASALYAANGGRAPGGDGQPGQNGQPPPMLYGAHGQPLGPAGPGGQPQYSYPPQPSAGQQPPPPAHYPPAQYPGYPPPPNNYGHGPPSGHAPPAHYEHSQQGPPPQTASSDRSDRGSLKRGPPDDDGPDANGPNHSPRPGTKARTSMYGDRQATSYDYNGPTSPATSTMSYQSYHPGNYNHNSNGQQHVKGNNSPPGLTPNSAHSLNSPHSTTMESRTPPPMPGSANSSQNGRNSMKVHEMLSNPNQLHHSHEQRGKSDNDMLSKLDGKK